MSLKDLIPEADYPVKVEITYEDWLHVMNNLQAQARHHKHPDDKVGKRSNSSYVRYLVALNSRIGEACTAQISSR
jgi:hypothetical protein